jgi:hypothetical protein
MVYSLSSGLAPVVGVRVCIARAVAAQSAPGASAPDIVSINWPEFSFPKHGFADCRPSLYVSVFSCEHRADDVPYVVRMHGRECVLAAFSRAIQT